jgi:hypothetical protein
MDNIERSRIAESAYRAGSLVEQSRRLIAGDTVSFGNEMREFVLNVDSEKAAEFIYNLLAMGVGSNTISMATKCTRGRK